MSELIFKGKEFVHNHHLSVPFRPLVVDASKGIGETSLDGNLIIQGDNLHALKALLPTYAGKVDCIFIDPPYNTGNEGWAYNDNVNSPLIREWLGKVVASDDLVRHDKWCCMMWPRLRLLHELLADTGMFFMTCDDNEQHHARAILDEIFGLEGFLATISWVKRYTRSNNAKRFYSMKDHLVVYRRSQAVEYVKEPRTVTADEGYTNPDGDPRGPWMTSSYVNPATKEQRLNLVYPIRRPSDGAQIEHPTHAWKYKRAEHLRHVEEQRLHWGQNGDADYPRLKLYLSETNKMVPVDVWNWSEVGSSDSGGKAVKNIFGYAAFDNPKPVGLVKKVISLIDNPSAVFLDSFAGSGTTAHAVLEANKRDGGNRRFILVEMEDYADSITAERVRRVIRGYPFKGTKKVELFRERVMWASVKSGKLAEAVSDIRREQAQNFDTSKVNLVGRELIVTGETRITERMEGLGGSFTYCTLGNPVELDRILTGESLPSYRSLAAVLFHMATNRAFDSGSMRERDSYLGEADGQHFWLIYKPDLDWLKSPDAALTLTLARRLAATDPEGRHLVFAAARYVSRTMLAEEKLPVEFAPLPFSLYRIAGG